MFYFLSVTGIWVFRLIKEFNFKKYLFICPCKCLYTCECACACVQRQEECTRCFKYICMCVHVCKGQQSVSGVFVHMFVCVYMSRDQKSASGIFVHMCIYFHIAEAGRMHQVFFFITLCLVL